MISKVKDIAVKRVWIYGAIVAAIAFAVRMAYLYDFRSSPFFTNFFLDPAWHDEWARELAAGNWLGDEVFFRAPLYPYFLGVIYKLSGSSLLVARIVQFLMGTMSSVLVYLIGRRLFERASLAVTSGIVFALYGPMIFYEGELLIAVLKVFLNLLGLWLLFIAREKKTSKYYVLAGFVFGLSAIARPNVLVPAAGFAVLMVLENGSEKFANKLAYRLAPFMAALLIAPMAVTVRNGIVGGDYVFISSQGGVNFYVGNNPNADGKYSNTPGDLSSAPAEKYRDSVWNASVLLAERIKGRKMKPSEVSGFWYKMALEWMIANPWKAIRLYFVKLFYLIHGHEIPSINVPYIVRDYSPVLKALMWDRVIAFPAGILIPLSIVGMIVGWPLRRVWTPLYIFVILYSGTILMFFVNSRFRTPLVGPLVLFAVLGAEKMVGWLSERRWRKFIPVSLLFSGLVVISNMNALDIRNDYTAKTIINIGNYYFGKDDLDQAAQYYLKVLESYPEHYQALGNLASIAQRQGDYKKAEELFGRALVSRPNDPYLHNHLGQLMEMRGDLDGAEAEYLQALELDPNYSLALSNLARVREEKGAYLQNEGIRK